MRCQVLLGLSGEQARLGEGTYPKDGLDAGQAPGARASRLLGSEHTMLACARPVTPGAV